MQSALLSAPWPTMTGPRIAVGIYGLSGVIYTCVVMTRARRQSDYNPVFEDWLFHAVLPFVGYAATLASVCLLPRWSTPLMFVIGGAAVLLLFVGIHNAWDAVTYILVLRYEKSERDKAGS
jgi:hypothetical protein